MVCKVVKKNSQLDPFTHVLIRHKIMGITLSLWLLYYEPSRQGVDTVSVCMSFPNPNFQPKNLQKIIIFFE